ncbi:MAG: hypothetical protein JWP09_544 [Candidatus Taylorbacteria bacterium]|nr:hypothetical protein [Candidatus Taylorbacteria bacterium]
MSLQDTKNQIIKLVDQISNLDISRLSPEGPNVSTWNNMDSNEISIFVDDIILVLAKIKTDTHILDTLLPNHLNELKNNLDQFTAQYNNLLAIQPNQITSHHHNLLNIVNTIGIILRSTGLYTQLKLTPGFNKITKNLNEANVTLKQFNLEDFNKAIVLVNDLIKSKVSFEDKTIKEHLGTFINSANEHKIHRKEKFFSIKFSGQWWWLFSAMMMGSIVALIVTSFISVLEKNSSISAGAAILRISSLIIPSYFTFFFISQFNYHKKMYEVYSFKNTSLNTMTELMKINQAKSDYILEKGLLVLFNEPQLKDEGKYDKQLVSDMLGIIKNQLGNK